MALGFGLIAEQVPALDGTLEVVVVVAAEDGGGHVDLADGVLQVAPDAFIPVVVGKVRMIDPVGVAFYRGAPEIGIHADLGEVLGGLQIEIIGVLVGAVLEGPGGDIVHGHQSGVADGEIAQHSVALDMEGLYLIRQAVSHDPGGEGQVGVTVHADAFDPILIVEPVQTGDAVGTLVHVGHILALGTALAPAVLIDVSHAALGIFLAQRIFGLLLIGVGPAGEGGGPGAVADRLIDHGAQLHAVIHRDHDLIPLIRVGLFYIVVIGTDGVAGESHGTGRRGGRGAVHGDVGIQVLLEEGLVHIDAVVLHGHGRADGSLHIAHGGGPAQRLDLDGVDAVGDGGGLGGLIPLHREAQVLGNGPEGNIGDLRLRQNRVVLGGGVGLGGQGRERQGQ